MATSREIKEAAVLAAWKKAGRDDSVLSAADYAVLQGIPYEKRYPAPKDWLKKIPNISGEAQDVIDLTANLFKVAKQSGVSPKVTVPPMRSLGTSKLGGLKSPAGYSKKPATVPLTQVAKRDELRKQQKAENWNELKRTAFGIVKSNINDVVSPEAKTIYDKLSGREDIMGFQLPKWLPALAKGGLVKKTGIVQVHAGEVVTPQHKAFSQEVRVEEHNKRVIDQDKQHHKEQVKKLDEQTTLLKSLGEQTEILKSIDGSIKNLGGAKKDAEYSQKRTTKTPSLKEELQEKKLAVKEKAKGWFRSKIGSKYAPKSTISGTTAPGATPAEGGGLTDFATNMSMYELAKKGIGKVAGYAGSALGYMGGAAVAAPAALAGGMVGLGALDIKKQHENPTYAKEVHQYGSAEGAMYSMGGKDEDERRQELIDAVAGGEKKFRQQNPAESNIPLKDAIGDVETAVTWLGSLWEGIKTSIENYGKTTTTPGAPEAERAAGLNVGSRQDIKERARFGIYGSGQGDIVGGINWGGVGTKGKYAEAATDIPNMRANYQKVSEVLKPKQN